MIEPITSSQTNDSRVQLTSDFDTFLTLLTTQLQNQDPLDPMDANQFTEQLVQFSQVEQQIQTNTNLENLAAVLSASASASAASFLGKSATINTPQGELGSDGMRWSYQTPEDSVSVSLEVQDSLGRSVFTAPADANAGEALFAWDGRTASGEQAKPGVYSLAVSAVSASGERTAAAASVIEQVVGIDLASADAALLTLSGSRRMSDITRIQN